MQQNPPDPDQPQGEDSPTSPSQPLSPTGGTPGSPGPVPDPGAPGSYGSTPAAQPTQDTPGSPIQGLGWTPTPPPAPSPGPASSPAPTTSWEPAPAPPPAPATPTAAPAPAPSSAWTDRPPAVGPWDRPDALYETGRPVGVLISAIILIALGLLFALFGGLFLLAGSVVDQLTTEQTQGVPPELISSLVSTFGGVLLVVGILQVIGGVAAAARRNWGRILAIILSICGLLLGLLFLVAAASPEATTESQQGALGIGLVLVLAYGFSIVALARAGAYYGRRYPV